MYMSRVLMPLRVPRSRPTVGRKAESLGFTSAPARRTPTLLGRRVARLAAARPRAPRRAPACANGPDARRRSLSTVARTERRARVTARAGRSAVSRHSRGYRSPSWGQLLGAPCIRAARSLPRDAPADWPRRPGRSNASHAAPRRGAARPAEAVRCSRPLSDPARGAPRFASCASWRSAAMSSSSTWRTSSFALSSAVRAVAT